MTVQRNLVVVGGSYVGLNVAQQLASSFGDGFRVVLIEKNSHFQHLFAFPRFAVTSNVNTHKAFIPYTRAFAACPQGSGITVQARVTELTKSSVQLDRKVFLDGQHQDNIPYSFLVVATGSELTPPSTLPGTEKSDGVAYLRKHVDSVARSAKIVVIGGGAVGIQIATDIKELYPEKSVTLAHSRKQLMNKFDHKLHDIVVKRCSELGIDLKLGSRVRLPPSNFPNDGTSFDINFEDGTSLVADLAIICTGQTPQSTLLQQLSPTSINGNGFIQTLKTLQINNPDYPNIFAIGDVADTGAHKAAKPGGKQAALVVKNIQHILNGEPLEQYEVTEPPGIHMSLGVIKSVAFGNPLPGASEPFTKHRDDGKLDMNIDGVWIRKGGGPDHML